MAENHHEKGVLRRSFAPAEVSKETAGPAERSAAQVLTALDYVGVIGIELFELKDGKLLVHEIAPRVHNPGHWTMDACAASQFEQHIRAVAGLPLAALDRHHDAVMKNLIGPEGLAAWPRLLRRPGVVPHLYGKAEARGGRKMGHANRLLPHGGLAGMADAELPEHF